MIAGYRIVQRLPLPLNMVYPQRVNRLKNAPELRVCFQPALGFTDFMEDVVIKDQRDGFCPPVFSFQVLKQADEQRRTFAVPVHVADFTRSAVQCSGEVVFFILPRRHDSLLLTAKLPVCAYFGLRWISASSS